MKSFHCDHCQQLVFFENVVCVNCGHALAYLPDQARVGSLDKVDRDRWQSPSSAEASQTYRLCRNYVLENVCNWAIPSDDPSALCRACRLTRVIPNLSISGNREAWYRLEVAKRRAIANLMSLGLRVVDGGEQPQNGLTFEFLADIPSAAHVVTGHHNGVITINIAEADDARREEVRREMREPYRTLLGHVRHELGHYFWDCLIENDHRLEEFRRHFGDETNDYQLALSRHYHVGAPENWQQQYVTSYASAHPSEDWAETWAHYLHMTDALETAATCGLSLRPQRADEPVLAFGKSGIDFSAFEQIMEAWFPLTTRLWL
ncbi:MAG: putative zinc-binding metallopeptidase [Betaproteobacteria bacterium]